MRSRVRFTLRQLQYFAAVARTGQISLAAKESHVTQSTMTAAIAELERSLDTLLFERGKGGVSLTHHGHVFLQHASNVLEAAEDAARHPFREQAPVTGTLQVAASYTVLGYFLLPFIAKFQKQYPGARIVPIEQDRARTEAAIASEELELAVVLTSNLREPKRFHRCGLARSRRQLWVSTANPLAERSQVSLRDVAPYAYIVPTVDEGETSAMRYWNEAGLQPASVIRTSSMEAVREMVALDLGVAILSDMIFRPWSLEGRRLSAVPLRGEIPTMEVGLIWLKGHQLTPVADAFRKYLQVAVGASSEVR